MKLKQTIFTIIYGIILAILLIGSGYGIYGLIKNNDQTLGAGELWYPSGGMLKPVVSTWGLSGIRASLSDDLTIGTLKNCDTIDADASGTLSCGTDATGTGAEIHSFLNSDYFNDVLTASVSGGSLIVGGETTWQELTIGASNSFLISDGTSASWDDLNKDLHGYTWTNVVDADITNTLTASELVCTDCINATEIEDIYFLTAGDIATHVSISDDLSITTAFSGAGLVDCDTANTSKLLWDATGKVFSCGTDYDTNTTYTAGDNLTLTGTDFDVDDPFTITTFTATHASISDDLTIGGVAVIPSNYVPYTGASGDVDLGANGLTIGGLEITGGYATFNGTTLKLTDTDAEILYGLQIIWKDEIDNPVISFMGELADLMTLIGSNNNFVNLDISAIPNSTAQTFTFPDTTGTFLLATGSQDFVTSGTISGTHASISDDLTIGNSDISFIRGVASISSTLWVGGAITGSLTGNASTATALAANGNNCPANQYPLGIDANGAVESCTADAGTTYTATSPLNLAGTAFTIDYASASGGGYLTSTDWSDYSGHMASANAHLDWTADQGATNINAGNYTDTNTTYTANEPLWLSGTTFDIDYASGSAGGYILGPDFETLWGHQASVNNHLDWTQSVGTINVGNYIEGITYTAGDNLTLTGTDFDVDDPFIITTFRAIHASSSDDLTIGNSDISFIGGVASISSTLWVGGTITGTISGDLTCTDCLNATEIEDIYLLDDGDVGTGTFDFGGAVIEITNATGPTVDAAGEIAIDTTEDQLVYFGAFGKEVIVATKSYAFGVASGSAALLVDGPSLPFDYTITSSSCHSGNVDGEIYTIDVYECSNAGTCGEHINVASVSCDNNAVSFTRNDSAGDKSDFYRFKIQSVNDACESTDQVILNLWGVPTSK